MQTKRITILVFSVFALIHLMIVLFNNYLFRTYAYDYGAYNFAFYDFAHFRVSACPIYPWPGVSFMQDHFSLTLIVLSPLYWLLAWLTGSYTLLIIQWALIVCGAYCTYKLILQQSRNALVALLALIFYFIIYSRYSSYQADCNLAIMGAAVVPCFMYFFHLGKKIPSILIFVFLLINREDFSLWLIFICIFLLIRYWQEKEKRLFALGLCITSILFFIATFAIFIPALEDENKKFLLFTYDKLGPNPGKAFLHILAHPYETFKMFFMNHHDGLREYDWLKAKFYFVFGLSGGILLLWRPVYLLVLFPLIAKKMLNDDILRWNYEMYYSVEVATILPLLVFGVISCFKTTRLQIITSSVVCVLTLCVSLYCFSIAEYPGVTNFKFNFMRSSFYKADCNVALMNRALSKIPANAAVSSCARIIPHLALREKIYYFPKLYDAEYVCVFKKGDGYPTPQEIFDDTLNRLITSKLWEIEDDEGNFILLKKTRFN